MNSFRHHFNTEFVLIENGILLTIKGELDATSSLIAINIFENIIESGVGRLVVDCSQLNNISSAGIGVILSAYHLSLQKHTALTLFGLQPAIKSMFDALGVDRLLHIAANLDEALAPVTVASRMA